MSAAAAPRSAAQKTAQPAPAPSAARGPRAGVRHDPRPKHIDGTSPLMKLVNKNPQKVYRAVTITGEFGLPRYRMLGWTVENYDGEENGLRFAAGETCPVGGPLESMGMVIVSMSAEKYAELEMYGEDGNGGQAYADLVEEKILDKRGGLVDRVRGIDNPRHFRLRNETSRDSVEEFSTADVESADDTF